jgi:DNA-binding transcriptional MerR regulator
LPRRSDTVHDAPRPELPDKQYFRIGEVAKLLQVKPSVLRFWETEFRSLRPEKTRTNQRRYSRRHVEKLMQIRELLYVRRFTIEGAKRALREDGGADVPAPGANRAALVEIKKQLEELLQLVAG